MNQHDAEILISTIKSLVSENPQRDNGKKNLLEQAMEDGKRTAKMIGAVDLVDATPRRQVEPFTPAREAPFDEEAMYQRFRARFIDDARIDPTLLHLIANQPEIIVEYERTIEKVDAGTLKGRIARLIAAGWFTSSRATSAVRRELARTGADPGGGGSLSEKLSELQRSGFLTREGEGWIQAPGIKVSEQEIEARA